MSSFVINDKIIYMNCLNCNEKEYPICDKCLNNPFLIEKVRQKLASKKEYSILKFFYNKKYIEIN